MQKFFAKMVNNEEGVGDIMVFEEPSPVEHTLGSTMSVAILDFRPGSSRVLPAMGCYEDIVSLTPLLLRKRCLPGSVVASTRPNKTDWL
jgi:hypothetical protein